jgi:LAO/AO transport system kinase
MKPFFVYMLRCADGSYYLGHTDDLELRIGQHHAGELPGYTRERRPVKLVWSQETATREEAMAAELRIKGWSRAKKEALIAGDWLTIQRHAWGTRNPLPERLTLFDTAAHQGKPRQSPSIPQGERSGSQPTGVQTASTPSVRPEVSKAKACEPSKPNNIVLLAEAVPHGDRRALAKAITLIESTRADHRAQADALLNTLLPHTGRSLRIGISGVPGVGKSTFIEALGLHLLALGHNVAVLAVDPSSTVSGGSILGDKTRMERLSVHERAFIRPSPTSGALGGVAEHTREALLLCEAAGFDVVIVETVGVGQSETTVAGMTDLFVLLQLPNAGDDLQAIKRGVMELADIVAINKADIDDAAATRAQAQITSALHIFGFHGREDSHSTPVLKLSALHNLGVDAFWQTVQDLAQQRRDSGAFDARRTQQGQAWLWDSVHSRLTASFKHHPAVQQALPQTLADVQAGRIAPTAAARALLNLFQENQGD